MVFHIRALCFPSSPLFVFRSQGMPFQVEVCSVFDGEKRARATLSSLKTTWADSINIDSSFWLWEGRFNTFFWTPPFQQTSASFAVFKISQAQGAAELTLFVQWFCEVISICLTIVTKSLRQGVWSSQCAFLTVSFWSLGELNVER